MKIPIRGTLFNCVVLLVCCLIGKFLSSLFSEELISYMLRGLGLTLVLLSAKIFLNCNDLLTVLISIVFGSAIGGALGITSMQSFLEQFCFECIGIEGNFIQACITSTIMFSFGPLTILGILEEGTKGDIRLLKFKSFLDGITAILLTITMGNGVFLSILMVLGVQTLFGVIVALLVNSVDLKKYINVIEGAGAVLTLSLAMNVLEPGSLPTLVFAPALFLSPFVFEIVSRVMAKFEPAT